MLNKTTLFLFVALSLGIWIGLSIPIFFTESKGSFVDELLKPGNIIGAITGGAAAAIVSYFIKRGKKES